MPTFESISSMWYSIKNVGHCISTCHFKYTRFEEITEFVKKLFRTCIGITRTIIHNNIEISGFISKY